ncbi:TetR-like C-terminal domain-containing protein [Amycolatopsis sp. H20-H5]|uniref:TetR-like C-terminal domain-containing protein n=1 Tax=Amycolatopsis sp. H20-H5 TaxID=3046309 RepID=UPI002DB69636|nr:TetR-like C-terminal domain-containing protein [Amycolatopsis sp. H20-H5]MEC3975764.1 TetR-like C-terminal domain-containing protein [Amycolatopsis sp. H20-H5]
MRQALVTTLLEHPVRARVICINASRMELRLREDAAVFGPLVRRAVDRQRYERVLLALVAGVSEVVIDWLNRGMTDSLEVMADHLTLLARYSLAAPT